MDCLAPNAPALAKKALDALLWVSLRYITRHVKNPLEQKSTKSLQKEGRAPKIVLEEKGK